MATSSPFPRPTSLYPRLRQRVREHLAARGLSERGGGPAIAKAAGILALLVGSYVGLVFFAESVWSVLLLAFLLSQAIILVGLNIMHDAGHGSFSRHGWVNTLMGLTLDLVGGNQWLWTTKHGHFHHSYTNIEGLDNDVDSSFVRLHPDKPWKPWHRFQPFYALPLYTLLLFHWIVTDFTEFFGRRIGKHTTRRPTRGETVSFLLFKLNFFVFALVVPMFFHPWYLVLFVFAGVLGVVGLVLTLVFQLAHVVDGVDSPSPDPETGRVEGEWAAHQLATTADFAPRSRFLAWYLGGLNFQVVHHLFPRISHLRYRELQPVLARTCAEEGIDYHCYPTLASALAAHMRQLVILSRPPEAPTSAPASRD